MQIQSTSIKRSAQPKSFGGLKNSACEAPALRGHNRVGKFRPEDAPRHCPHASNRRLRRIWAAPANEELRDGGDEDEAIDAANFTIERELEVDESCQRAVKGVGGPVDLANISSVRRTLTRESPADIPALLGSGRGRAT